jgi:hypothetical protein
LEISGSYVFDLNIHEQIPQNSGAQTMIVDLEKLKAAHINEYGVEFLIIHSIALFCATFA